MRVVWTILSIIGILILALLLLGVLLILLVLLCPIRYKAVIIRQLTNKPEGRIRVHWLLHLLSVHVDYREKLSYKVKILGFTLLKDDDVLAPKEDTAGGDSADTGKQSSGSDAPQSGAEQGSTVQSGVTQDAAKQETVVQGGLPQGGAEQKAVAQNDVTQGQGAMGQGNPAQSDAPQGDAPETDTETSADEAHGEKEKISFLKRVGQLLRQISGFLVRIPEYFAVLLEKLAELLEKFAEFEEGLGTKADQLLDKLDELQQKKNRIMKMINDTQNRSAVTAAFGSIGGLLTHIRPRKLKIEGRLGFDDPATTGQVFGILGMLMPLYGETIHLEAVFDETVMEGRLEAKGRIRIAIVMVIVLRLIIKREVRRLIAQVRGLKKA